jgi:hypothetical protein
MLGRRHIATAVIDLGLHRLHEFNTRVIKMMKREGSQELLRVNTNLLRDGTLDASPALCTKLPANGYHRGKLGTPLTFYHASVAAGHPSILVMALNIRPSPTC